MKTLLVILSLAVVTTAHSQDTLKVWRNGYDACYRNTVLSFSESPMAAIKADTVRPVTVKRVYTYFSSSVLPDTVSAWINRGYLIYYFGSQSATTKKIPVRGMRPI